ncbi:MAG TPA: phospholipase D-like domain-containing protein [Streptosporangiaceae bacterium]|nr:phospholipase D-like domain-containing protein [Streptosporangiaceae bacterium]
MAADLSVLNDVIGRHLAELTKPGALSVRPGYKMTGGWLTDTPAIVVTVAEKKSPLPAADLVPPEVGGVPTDVRAASPRKRKELEDPSGYAHEYRLTPDQGSVPHFADEQTLGGTQPGTHPAALASAHAAVAAVTARKPQLDYRGPDGVTLAPVEAQATIQLSASPDTGWPTLKGFLAATTESLTVGLYDFTSAHVLDAVQADLDGRQLSLVLDYPAKNPTADQTDPDTVAALRATLAGRFTQAWALTRTDKDATAWIYPSAYHIKVAVRDRAAFWLSSGNWNNSNQPDIDPVTTPGDAAQARHRDRDWHVVIEQPQLAGVLEDYIQHDLTVAVSNNSPPEQAGPPLTPPSEGSTETPAFATFFPAQTVTGTIRITPLLTPDPGVYTSAVNDLIASATSSLYLQFQYIELPRQTDATSQAFVSLVQAVIDRQSAGVDVKIIMSEFETAGYLEQLQALGLDVVNNVKIQNNVHNKGIIADGQRVLVSSQNWSTDGTLYHRDAGVIIDHPGAAQYFQQIFQHDWDHLARQQARSD